MNVVMCYPLVVVLNKKLDIKCMSLFVYGAGQNLFVRFNI
jgi:hypothetical protein